MVEVQAEDGCAVYIFYEKCIFSTCDFDAEVLLNEGGISGRCRCGGAGGSCSVRGWAEIKGAVSKKYYYGLRVPVRVFRKVSEHPMVSL